MSNTMNLSGLDLDTELMSHIGAPDSWSVVGKVDPVLLQDQDAREMLHWQRGHVARYGAPASRGMLTSKFGDALERAGLKELPEPQTDPSALVEVLIARHIRNGTREALRTAAREYKDLAEDPRTTAAALEGILGKAHRELQTVARSFTRQTNSFVVPMSDIPDAPQEFLVSPYIPLGIFTLLQGQGGVGKSVLTSWWTAELTSGRIPMDGNVLIIGDEDAPAITRSRLSRMGADLSRVRWWNLDQMPVSFPSGAEELEAVIRENDIRLVILDTVTELLDPKLKINEAADVTEVVRALRKVAASTKSAILGVGHTNRVDSGDAYKVIGGSIAWFNRAKSVLLLGADPDVPDESIHLFQKKANYAKPGAPQEFEKLERDDVVFLKLTGESDRLFTEVFTAKTKYEQSKTDRTDGWLAKVENAGELPVDLDALWDTFQRDHPDVSRTTFDRVRKTRGWTMRRGSEGTYVGTLASFTGWTTPQKVG